MKRWIAALMTVGILFLSACGDGLQEEKLGGVRTADGEIYPDKVASFNGHEISFDEFRYYYLNYRDMYLEEDASYFSQAGAEDALKEEILNCLLTSWSVRFLAEEMNLSLTGTEKSEVRQEIADTVSLYGKEELIESLHNSYMSQQMYREMTSYTTLYEKLFNKLYGEDGSEVWDDARFLDYYREQYLGIQVIYLAYEPGEEAAACPETTARAEEILTEYRDGADFWSLVEQYGEDEAMELSPEGYYVTEGEAEEALYQAALALKENEVSDPVPGATGVYLLRRVALQEEKMLLRKQDVLEGYYDGVGDWHAGAYEDAFLGLLQEKAETIRVELDPVWEKISTKSVF